MHVVNSTASPIRLGRRGENLVTQVKFDIARWLGELGDGTAVLLVQRPDDAEPYMAEVSRDGASVVWDVTAVDTASAGFGSCELQYIIGERIAKSAVFMTDVAAALGDPSEDTPDPFVAWEQRVVLASVAAQEAAAQIINMQVRAVTLEPDEEAYVQTAVVEDVYQMTFGIPRGHDGQGGGGTGDHSRLSNRDLNDQHPMEAITGLVEALLAKYVKPDGGIPASDLAEAVRSSLAKAESALQTAPVASVNGKTGAVRLTPADLGIGSVFTLKGSKPSAAALPTTGNAIGDVWYVVDQSVGYIWLNDGQTNRWEQLGLAVDLSAYQTKSISDPGGYFQSDTVEGALQELGGAMDDMGEALDGKQDALITSGAAVGQIVRITAVDENGKPTEWGAVDLPGGGGDEWELIADIVLSEPVTAVEIKKDMDGADIHLKKFYVLLKSAVDAANPFNYMNCKINTGGGAYIGGLPNGMSITNNATNSSTQSIRYFYEYCEYLKFVGCLSINGVSTNPYNQSAQIQQMLPPQINYNFNDISRILVYGNDGQKNIGGVGTTLKVWGVRA